MARWLMIVFVILLTDSLLDICVASKWPKGSFRDLNLGSCRFPKHTYMNDRTIRALTRIQRLIGRRYETAEDDNTGNRKPYKYGVGICTEGTNKKLDDSKPRPDNDSTPYSIAGVLQWNSHRPDESPNVLGVVTKTEIISGTDWVSVIYEGGDHHKHKCNDEERRSIIMIKCAEGEMKGNLKMIEANTNKTEDCFYLFELEHNSVCRHKPYILSVGSIIIIAFVAAVVLYLMIGICIQRFCFHAVGAEQIPNYSFWRACAHLQSCCCNVICQGNDQTSGSYNDVPGSGTYNDISNKSMAPDVTTDTEKNNEEAPITNAY